MGDSIFTEFEKKKRAVLQFLRDTPALMHGEFPED